MRSHTRRTLVLGGLAVLWVLLPGAATAQSTIAGQVTDTTGAVLPGVSVEASSPALIEKVRTVVTNADGRYSIVDLRPGTYVVSFTLTGFSTVKREGVDVSANVTVPVNAELRVSAVEETITVTGATPVVDIQQAAQRQVLSRDTLDALPMARSYLPARRKGVHRRRGRLGTCLGADCTGPAVGRAGTAASGRRFTRSTGPDAL